MAGVKISIVDDVTSFLRGAGRAEDALDDVADSLDDLARSAQRDGRAAGDDLAKGIDRGGDRVDDVVEGMERSFRDLADTAKRQTKKAGDDIGDNVKAGYRDASKAAKDFEDDAERAGDRASETTDEFKDEARSNFSEVASSFSGDMTSAVDLVQGTLGGLAGSIPGGIGLAMGGLAIAGGAFAAKWQEAAERTEKRISDMYNDMLQSGADYLSKDYIAEQLALIYDGAEDAAIKVSELRDLAANANIAEPLLARALVGDADARREVEVQITSQRLAITEALDAATARGENLAPALSPAIQALQDIEDNLGGASEGLLTAQRNAEAARLAISGIQTPTDQVARSAEEARAQFDGIGRSISNLPATKAVRVQADFTDFDTAVRTKRPVEITGLIRAGKVIQ